MRPWARWAIVVAAVAVLTCLPAIIAARPVSEPAITTDQLVSRIMGSSPATFEGLYESRGGLALPDVGRYADLLAPFAETTRVRVWYAAEDRWRADDLSIGGETDWYRTPDRVVRWDSADRRATVSERNNDEPLRVPRPMDLSPPELGRRVVREATSGEITRIGPGRVAGRTAAGVRITPASPTTTLESIDLWADAGTGLVLGVEVHSGGPNPILETAFLDVSFATPPADVLDFTGSGVHIRSATALDPVEQLAGAAALIAPATAAVDLPRRGEPAAATFGTDFAIVVVTPVSGRGLPRALGALAPTDRPWGGQAALVETPLINVELATINGLDYLIGGTVTVAELDRIAGSIAGAGG